MAARSSAANFPVFLRAQYSGGEAFAQFKNDARQATDDVKRHVRAAGDEMGRILQRAMTGPAGGVPDLGIDQMRAASAAADERARALRQMATAAATLAGKEGQLSTAQQAVIATTEREARAEERRAATLREQLPIFDAIQREMRETASASAMLAGHQDRLGGAVRGNRMAMIQGSQQVQDFWIQVGAGANPVQAATMQLSQLMFVMQGAGGAAGRLAAFMGTGLGAGIMLGVVALGMFIPKLMESNDEVEKATRRLEENARQTEATRLAQEAYGRTLPGIIEAINTQTDALARQNMTLGENQRLVLGQAQQSLRSLEQTRDRVRRDLVGARAELAAARAVPIQSGEDAEAMRIARVERAQREFDRLESIRQRSEVGISQARTLVREAEIPIIRRQAEALANPLARIAQQFEESARAIELAGYSAEETARRLAANTRARERAEEAERRRTRRNPDSRETGRMISVAEAREIVATIQGARVTSGTRDRATQERLYQDYLAGRGPLAARPGTSAHERGNAVDIVGATVAEVRRAFRERGVNLTRAFTETNPRTGARHVHAEWSRSASAETEVMREAEERARQLAQDLEAVTRAFDQTRAAAEDYAETLARISRLEAAGAITGAQSLTYQLAAFTQRSRQLAEGEERRWSEILGDNDLSRRLENIADGWGDRMTDGSIEAAEALRERGMEAIEAITSLFGQRAAGIGSTLAEAMFSDPSATRLDGRALGGLGGFVNLFERERSAREVREMSDEERAAAGPDPYTYNPMLRGMRSVFDPLRDELRGFTRSLGNLLGDNGGELLGRLAAYGTIGSSVSRMTGGSGLAGSLGGAIGGVAGKAFGKAIGSQLGGLAGPIGSAVGGYVFGQIGNSLRSTPRASSTISVGADGRLVVGSTAGTSKLRGATVEAADSAISTIEKIAEALGGSVLSGVGSVSIGIRDGKYRVDPSGRGVTKTKKGAIDFGEDAEAAVRAATLDLIRDGIIGGLRASTQRLLQNAKDLDAGIERAVRFESVFTRLKEHLDPLGAALDTLDKEFTSLQKLFADAGASVEELRQLEELYGLDRKRVLEETTQSMTSALREMLDDLTVNNDALSLGDRLAAARAKYDPLAADVAAGKTVDYDAFAEAARTFLEINRQLSGSQSGYFTALDEVTALTKKALADQENIVSIGTGRATPFDRPSGAGAADGSQPVVGAIEKLGDYLGDRLGGELRAVNDNLGTLIRQGAAPARSGGTGAAFAAFDDMRNF